MLPQKADPESGDKGFCPILPAGVGKPWLGQPGVSLRSCGAYRRDG